MHQPLTAYLINQLAYTGWAIADPEIAQELRPDLLTSPYAAAGLGSLPALDEFARKRHISRFWLTFANGSGAAVPVLARSDSQLHRRIGEVVGRSVLRVKAVDHFVQPAPAPQPKLDPEDKPPAHHCTAREEWFRSRNLVDPEKPRPLGRPPARQAV